MFSVYLVEVILAIRLYLLKYAYLGRKPDLGDEHTAQYTDDGVQNCTPETYIILLTNVTPNKFNQKGGNV